MAGDCGSVCPVAGGFYSARPNIGANGALVALFAALVPLCLFYGLRYRTIIFSGFLSTGCLLSALGFLGRLLLNSAPTSPGYFLLSLLGTVLGPVFIAVAAFEALPHILNVYGERISPVRPWVVAITLYAACLVVGLLELIGFCLAVFPPGMDRNSGTSLIAGGLGVQLLTFVGFTAVHAWFRMNLRTRRADIDPKHSALYESTRFRRFLLSTQVAVLLLAGYSTYRIAEMAQGIAGSLFQNQYATCFLDGLVVWLAALLLLLPHPGYTFRAAWGPTSAFCHRKRPQRRRTPPTSLNPMQDRPEGYKAHARYDPNIRAQISPTSQRSPRAPEHPANSPGLPSHPKASLKTTSPLPSPTETMQTTGTIENRTSLKAERKSNVPPKRLVEEDTLW
ncbi:Sphingoid long-chain base transporter-like protein [Emericellopsis cladophorae]|uniref:Sphingoid long-chain base transporter-like protein n=1 Tax=Emericellopsis cladophorae TaxID=2686198 RepID=A0A9Q0BEM2_9HYPO|nr:Sphingoid long-chain base transporter-like protein [Emericellopsis cladophorae]KAI6782016.1 Sphingoid long-chain base transporter-like protein [Emericellopsis cladophorae]